MARLVVRNALFRGRERVSDLVIPWTTFTSPEVARVGLSEDQLRERAIRFETIAVPLAENDRARLDGAADGFLRVHHRRGRDEILGATLVGEHAGETIGELVLAMRSGIGLGALSATIHPYPTQAEVIRRAGRPLAEKEADRPQPQAARLLVPPAREGRGGSATASGPEPATGPPAETSRPGRPARPLRRSR